MKTYVRIGAALMVTALLPACATVTRGTKQQLTIRTEPPGADVRLSNGMTCVSPCDLRVRRKETFTANISKQGYQAVTVPMTSKMHGGGALALAGNVLIGGLIGVIVDVSTGALRDVRPGPIDLTLQPTGALANADMPLSASVASIMPAAPTTPYVASRAITPTEPKQRRSNALSAAIEAAAASHGNAAVQSADASYGNPR
jgi:hypothetical protein